MRNVDRRVKSGGPDLAGAVSAGAWADRSAWGKSGLKGSMTRVVGVAGEPTDVEEAGRESAHILPASIVCPTWAS
mgnify:CR=1 FL=1